MSSVPSYIFGRQKPPIVHGCQITCMPCSCWCFGILFCKIQERPRSCQSYHLWKPWCWCGSTPKLPVKLPCQHARDTTIGNWRQKTRLMQILTIGSFLIIQQWIASLQKLHIYIHLRKKCWSISSKKRSIGSLKLGHQNWACTACLPGMLCGLVVYVTAWSSQSRFPCAKKEDRQCIAVPPPARRRRRASPHRAAPPPLQGLVNHDPFIEGVLSEGSEVMGHTPSWSRWKNNFLHHRSRHRSSSHWRSLAGLLAAPHSRPDPPKMLRNLKILTK